MYGTPSGRGGERGDERRAGRQDGRWHTTRVGA